MKLLINEFFSQLSKYRNGIMGLAMFSIMLSHQEFSSFPPFNFFHNYGHWGVEIFLFLSGMGMVRSLAKNSVRIFFYHRLQRLFPACLFFGLFKWSIFQVDDSCLSELHINLWSCFSLDLWFIHSIIIYYIMSPLLYRFLMKYPELGALTVLIAYFLSHFFLTPIVGYNWRSPIGVLTWTLGRLPVFVFGMFFALSPKIIYKQRLYMCLGAFIFAVLLVIIAKMIELPLWISCFLPLCTALGTPVMVIGCIILLSRIPALFRHFCFFTGSISLELYLIHEFVIWSLYLKAYNLYNNMLLLLVAILLSFVLAYVGKTILNRILVSITSSNDKNVR